MLARGGTVASGAGKRINICYRVQAGVGIHQNGTAVIEACHMRLIVITQAVHLPAPVSDVGSREHGVVCDLDFRTKTSLLDIAGTLVRILGAKLELGQIKTRSGDRAQWEAVF